MSGLIRDLNRQAISEPAITSPADPPSFKPDTGEATAFPPAAGLEFGLCLFR